ncbi:MAG: arginine--tRNA ligase [Pseudomonadales bacterium]
MNIKQFLVQQVSKAMQAAGLPEGSEPLVTQSTRPEFGDYQANGALPAAKKMKTNPRELAGKVVTELALDGIADKIDIAGPGFINIHLAPDYLAQLCEQALADEKLTIKPARDAQTVVVDYSGPNLAKEMHVGHLRSTIIGDAVARVLEFSGDTVIRQNHMGDWGTQFGMLIAELEGRLQSNDNASMALADLEGFYQQSKKHFDDDNNFANTARDYVVKLQSGDEGCKRLWQQFIDVSVAHSEDIYRALNVSLTPRDIRPESAYNADLSNVVSDLQDQQLAVTSEGAQAVFLQELANKDGEPSVAIVQKSDGGYLYATTDLAALRYRQNELNADRILYFVDARQALHLQQVFTIARKANFVKADMALEHLAFGTMMGKDGKPFKTRAGGTVKLAALLNEAVERAAQLIAEKDPELDEASRLEVAKKVGIGAVKYADLSKNRTSDYIFNWDSMLSFEGNTAPYLQYAYARIQSIFRKADVDPAELKAALLLEHSNERTLGLKLLQFSEVIEQVANDCMPNVLCAYLYELASDYMSFYEACPILKEGVEEAARDSRLQLCALVSRTLATGLDLLGIEVMDRM